MSNTTYLLDVVNVWARFRMSSVLLSFFESEERIVRYSDEHRIFDKDRWHCL